MQSIRTAAQVRPRSWPFWMLCRFRGRSGKMPRRCMRAFWKPRARCTAARSSRCTFMRSARSMRWQMCCACVRSWMRCSRSACSARRSMSAAVRSAARTVCCLCPPRRRSGCCAACRSMPTAWRASCAPPQVRLCCGSSCLTTARCRRCASPPLVTAWARRILQRRTSCVCSWVRAGTAMSRSWSCAATSTISLRSRLPSPWMSCSRSARWMCISPPSA